MRQNGNFIERIKAEAANLGFSLFGISAPDSLAKTYRYKNWLVHGFQASMGYLSQPDSLSKRFSPTLLVKNCKSIISLGFSYSLIDHTEFPNSSISGWISSYAVFEDYHSLLIQMGEKMVAIIKDNFDPNHSFRIFTDSAPILEREFGVLGNLGWIGKNTNLISPALGSTFLLAEILTDIEMDPSPTRIPDRCGKCQRCINACPTHCIQPDRTLDARRCISYLTIENKGEIAIPLRENIGHWVFGCDICQMVCPWNHYPEKKAKNFPRNKIESIVNLERQLSFTQDEFMRFYSGTSVLRSGWLGFKRNLIIASGNLRNLETMSNLIQILTEQPSSMVRAHAAWALGKFHTNASQNALVKAFRSETDAAVVNEIQLALT
jgi:epoxyqueuosine reductase